MTKEKIQYKLFGKYYILIETKNEGFSDICSIFGVIKYIYKYGNSARIIIQ